MKQLLEKRQRGDRLFPLKIFLTAASLLYCSCSGVNNLPSDPDYTFTVFPVEMSNISQVVGFGTHGSSHLEGVTKWYFYTVDNYDVRCPGDGIVTEIRQNGEVESRVRIDFSQEIYVRFDHLILDTSIKKGAALSAGTVIGTTSTFSALDFNVLNRKSSNGLHSSWPREYRYAVCPMDHLSESLQSAFLTEWNDRWLPGLFSPERCEPFWCTDLNINADYSINGVWFTHDPEDETYGVVFAFTDCDSSWSGGDIRVRMKFKADSSPSETSTQSITDLGSGLTRFYLDDLRYLLFQFVSAGEVKLEFSDTALGAFTDNARIYDRKWENMWDF